MESEVIAALRRAVEAAPGDITLRLHLAEQLRLVGDTAGAVTEIAAALQLDPMNPTARQAMDGARRGLGEAATPRRPGFDWSVAEEQVADIAGPMFVEHHADDRPGARATGPRSSRTGAGSGSSRPTSG